MGTQPLYATGERQTTVDTVIPQFHKRVQNGEVFFNPYKTVKETAVRTGTGNGVWRRSPTAQNCSGQSVYWANRDVGNQVENLHSVARGQALIADRLPALADIMSPSDINSLVVEASTKVRNDRGRNKDLELFEGLAEADKSLGMLSEAQDGFRKLWNQKRRDYMRSSKTAAQLWLLYRYGFKPVMQDIQGLVEGLQKTAGLVRKTTRASVSAERHSMSTVTYTGTSQIVDIGETLSDEVIVRAMSLDEFEASSSYYAGFTVKGLVTLPWELTRYSFVVDWFTNVGDFIGSLVPAVGWNQLGSCITVDRRQTIMISALATRMGSYNWPIVEPASGTYLYTKRTKQRFPSLPTPGIVVKSNWCFANLTRCLDSAALLRAAFK